jgi:hypothetical protein
MTPSNPRAATLIIGLIIAVIIGLCEAAKVKKKLYGTKLYVRIFSRGNIRGNGSNSH